MSILNQLFEKIYVITCPYTLNRMDDLNKFFVQHNIKYELTVAPDKSFMKDLSNKGNYSLLSANQSILLKSKIDKLESFCIIEDDILFDELYETKLDRFINSIESNWDILNLGYHYYTYTKEKTNDVYHKITSLDQIIGTHVVSYKSTVIDHILNEIKIHDDYPIDWLLLQGVYTKFNSYVPHDKIFYPSSYREGEFDKNESYKRYPSSICDV